MTTTTDASTNLPAQPASAEQLHALLAELSTEQDLERAQAKLELLNRTHAELETQTNAKHIDVYMLDAPDAREAAQAEANRLERRARAVRNRIVVAVLEVRTARLEHSAAEIHARAVGVPAARGN